MMLLKRQEQSIYRDRLGVHQRHGDSIAEPGVIYRVLRFSRAGAGEIGIRKIPWVFMVDFFFWTRKNLGFVEEFLESLENSRSQEIPRNLSFLGAFSDLQVVPAYWEGLLGEVYDSSNRKVRQEIETKVDTKPRGRRFRYKPIRVPSTTILQESGRRHPQGVKCAWCILCIIGFAIQVFVFVHSCELLRSSVYSKKPNKHWFGRGFSFFEIGQCLKVCFYLNFWERRDQ